MVFSKTGEQNPTSSLLHNIFDKLYEKDPEITGFSMDVQCFDCKKNFTFQIELSLQGFVIQGALYRIDSGTMFFKCHECYQKNRILLWQKCEVYSRVVGYLRPVKDWNDGKQAEFRQRKNFKLNGYKRITENP